MTLVAGQIDILIVEAHAMVADGLASVLAAEQDFRIVGTAWTARDAERLVAALDPDVVVLDARLPDDDGTAVAARIRARHPRTRVVVISATDSQRIAIAAVEAGCSGFLSKGSRAAELAHALRRAHAGEAVIDPATMARLLPRLLAPASPRGSALTSREREILTLLAAGRSTAEMAAELYISPATVRNHVQRVITKLDAHSKLEAVAVAVREGLVDIG
jgi:DNA-binding NarL/FixJ family response regulator